MTRKSPGAGVNCSISVLAAVAASASRDTMTRSPALPSMILTVQPHSRAQAHLAMQKQHSRLHFQRPCWTLRYRNSIPIERYCLRSRTPAGQPLETWSSVRPVVEPPGPGGHISIQLATIPIELIGWHSLASMHRVECVAQSPAERHSPRAIST